MYLRKTNSTRLCINEIKGEETRIGTGENFCYEQKRCTECLQEGVKGKLELNVKDIEKEELQNSGTDRI